MPADKTITELESISSSSLSLDDELPIYEKTSGSTLKTTIGDLKGLCLEDAVMKTGDTMTGTLTINKIGEKFIAKDERMDVGAAPSSALYNDIFYALDKNEELCGQLSIGQWTTGLMNMIIGARALNGSSSVLNQIQLGAKTDGTLSVSLTAPSAWRSAIGLGGFMGDQGTVTFSGAPTLANIATWIKNNYLANAWRYQRFVASQSGYFGMSGFNVMANMSSANYGWGFLESDNASNYLLFFRVSAGIFYWYKPTVTSVNG